MADYKASSLASRPAGLDPAQYYGLTQEQRRVQEERAAIRARLKRQYQLQLNNPWRSAPVADPAFERWMMTRNQLVCANMRLNPRLCLTSSLYVAVPLLLIYTIVSQDRKRVLKNFKDGKIPDPYSSNF